LFSEFDPELPSTKRQRGDTALTSPDALPRRELERDEAADHEVEVDEVVRSALPEVIPDVADTDSLKIGPISYQSISKPYSVLPNDVKTVIFRWMRKYDQVLVGSQSPLSRRLSTDLLQSLGFLDPSKEQQLREICVEKTKRLVYSKGRHFNGTQYTQDREGNRTWAFWTEDWLGEDWDGDIRPPNRKKRLVSRNYIHGLGESRDARRSEELSDRETRGHQSRPLLADPEHLRIGRITWSDISKPAPYYFPHEVKVAILRWMRRQDGPMGFKRHTLWAALGFLDESKDAKFREKCQEKAKTFIQNQTVYFKGKQYTQDEDGNRIWAPWTAAWLEDDWDGNTNPPTSPSSSVLAPKPQQTPITHREVSPHDVSQNVKTEPKSAPPTPLLLGPSSANSGTRSHPTNHMNEPNGISNPQGSNRIGGGVEDRLASLAGDMERGALARSRHSLGSGEVSIRRASIRRSLQDPITESNGVIPGRVSPFSGHRTQRNSNDIYHGLPAPDPQPLGHIIDLSGTPQHSTARTPANSLPMSPADEHKAPSPQPVRKNMLPTPNRSQPPQESNQPPCRPYADCHQVISSHLFSLKWEECRALIRLLETSPWNPDIA
jgi:hypothetical protein